MIPLSLHNLAIWSVQVLIITSAGALLPRAFRIHHPRSNLVYYRVVLLAALLLPVIQPIHHDIVLVRDGLPSSLSPATSTETLLPQDSISGDWRDVVLGLIVAGIIVRIAWLTGGLWQLRRLRKSSAALYPIPRAVQNARAIIGEDAQFGISNAIKGPVTFGFLHPVILLPQLFLEMPEEEQVSIACHELLHIRRNDWLLTMLEELLASPLWFQPAVWWLVAQSQLAREQIVDAGVVSLTRSRESYIKTLFSLADVRWEAGPGIASTFLRRRHLFHRVHSLLTEVSMSRTRLLSSYGSIALLLAISAVLILVELPLTGEAEVRHVAAPEQPGPVQNSPGYVVNRNPISYPLEAQQKRIEGTVVVELAFNASGEIVDTRVLSGPEGLRQAALQTAVQGTYPIDVARTLQVVVDFKLPAPGQRGLSLVPGARGGGPAPATPGKIRVSGNVAAKNLVSMVPPAYPPEAIQDNVQGVVVLEANITKEGKVESVNLISGQPLLAQAAMDAVRQWVYRPVLLNGQPVDVVTTISINRQ